MSLSENINTLEKLIKYNEDSRRIRDITKLNTQLLKRILEVAQIRCVYLIKSEEYKTTNPQGQCMPGNQEIACPLQS